MDGSKEKLDSLRDRREYELSQQLTKFLRDFLIDQTLLDTAYVVNRKRVLKMAIKELIKTDKKIEKTLLDDVEDYDRWLGV